MADEDTRTKDSAGVGAAAGAATSGSGITSPAASDSSRSASDSNRRTAKWVEVTFRGHYSKSNQTEFIRAETEDKSVRDYGIGDRFKIGIEKLGRLRSLGYSFDVHND